MPLLLFLLADSVAVAKSSVTLAINVTLSPAAEHLLTSQHEGIVVWASYYGSPTTATIRHVDQVGRIQLGHDRIILEGRGGVAHFPSKGLLRSRLGWIIGLPQVNVNVYSARRRGPDNILDCDIFEGPLTATLRAPHQLECRLLTEPR